MKETLQRYSHVEQELQQRRERLSQKKPEITSCLDAVKLLLEKQESDDDIELDFSLSDQVYARAKVQKAGYIGLWLGAGIMVEYSLEEAKSLLEEQLVSCVRQLDTLVKDCDYVRDQVTTTEVTMARVYNHSVATAKAT